ncbi:hypothetical protein EUX98_g3195 [Antrodiella citrinella]|uniref:Uncharacterized protein n=1 Tax=Antrodiella citrinella TaxID=2447956 RepID=A0A4S4MX74_9APHY|nr:hypothetical protein EUX98_g3195 [Antrodiella citrinella]
MQPNILHRLRWYPKLPSIVAKHVGGTSGNPPTLMRIIETQLRIRHARYAL